MWITLTFIPLSNLYFKYSVERINCFSRRLTWMHYFFMVLLVSGTDYFIVRKVFGGKSHDKQNWGENPKSWTPHYFHPTRQLEWPTLLNSTLIRCRFESVTVFGAFFLLVLCEHMELNLILMCPYCSSTFNCHSLPPVIVRVNIQPSFRIPLRAKWSEDTEEPWALTCTSYPWEAQFSHTE